MRTWLLISCTLGLAGCATEADDGVADGEADPIIAEGKTDAGGISPHEFRARAVLRFANTASKTQLRAAGLASRVVDVLLAVREGDDEQSGTADDGHFDRLADLDAVPFVGPSVFAALVPAALAALPEEVEAGSCETPTRVMTKLAGGGVGLVPTPFGDLYLRAGHDAAYVAQADGAWTRDDSIGDAWVVDRAGAYAVGLLAEPGASAALTISMNVSGRWVTEEVIPATTLCEQLSFTCGENYQPWRTVNLELALDERGFFHVMLLIAVDGGYDTRNWRSGLVYATNASGTWKSHEIAEGATSATYTSSYTAGTPKWHPYASYQPYAKLCTGTHGAAVAYVAHTGNDYAVGSVAIVSAAPAGRDPQRVALHPHIPVSEVDCDSVGDRVHLVFESAQKVGHIELDLQQARFTTPADEAPLLPVMLHPTIRVDRSTGTLHVVGNAYVDNAWRYYHAFGASAAEMYWDEIPPDVEGLVAFPNERIRDMVLDHRGALHIALGGYNAHETVVYSQRCQ